MKKEIFIILMILSIPLLLYGEDNKGIGYRGASFLNISPAARQVAMGEAFTGLADDVNLMRYNIGGLGNLVKISLAANYHQWFDDTKQGSLVLAIPGALGVFAVDFNYFNEGEIDIIDEEFNPTGGVENSNDMYVQLAYGNNIDFTTFFLAFAGGFEYVHQNLVSNTSSSYGLNFGAQIRSKYVSAGATIQHIGLKKVKFENLESSLPQTYRVGLALHSPISSGLQTNLTTDVVMIKNQNPRYNVGGEFIISDLVAVRGGYKFSDIEANSWALGLGLFIPMDWLANSSTRLDYTYSPLDPFDKDVHRFSLVFTFGVAQRVSALFYENRERFDDMNERLRRELEAAEAARLAAQQAEERTRLLEEEIAQRLARIRQIAEESQGKIEVEPQEDDKILVSLRINFNFDKANIRKEEFPTMTQIGEILNTYPNAMVHISGHTDSLGTQEYNIHLSQRRMDSVMVYLIKKENVVQDRFFMPVGYGEMRPVDDNGTPEGQFRNRRVEFLLYTMESKPEIPEGSAVKNIRAVDSQTVEIICNGTIGYTDKIFTKPDRLVIDFPGIFNLTSRNTFELNRGVFQRARVGYHADEKFTRVVFDLKTKSTFTIKRIDNIIRITTK